VRSPERSSRTDSATGEPARDRARPPGRRRVGAEPGRRGRQLPEDARDGRSEALTRALRDRRFDRTLARALGADGEGLSADAIDRQVGAYRRRMLAFNAETNARTASIDAMKLGQRLSWEDAADKGIVKLELLEKTWRGVKDDRERPSISRWRADRAFDQPFSNGQTIPGEDEFNCRPCITIVRERRS
jgi:hypothetical protein